MQVRLVPKTNRAANKIYEAGHPEFWLVTDTKKMVGFSDREGPWLHVIPMGNNPDKSRWVHQYYDTDFIVKEL